MQQIYLLYAEKQKDSTLPIIIEMAMKTMKLADMAKWTSLTRQKTLSSVIHDLKLLIDL